MLKRLCLLLAATLVCYNSAAHHAAAGIYDRNDIGEIEGEIVSVFWRNPHVRLEIARDVGQGPDQIWEVEFGSVNTVERLGVARDSVRIGDRVSVSGSLGRNGRPVMFAGAITLSTGEELLLQAAAPVRYGLNEATLAASRNAAEELRADIFRIWIPNSRPETGSGTTVYPLTEAGRLAQASWDAADDPALQCIPPGLPTAMDNPYPIEFVDEGNRILMRLEEWDGVRTIFLRPDNVGEPIQPRMGVSIGTLEGRTLSIRTTDIDWRYVDDLGTPQSEDVVIDETFTLSEDGTTLAWEARITDPVNFTEPVVMTGDWVWLAGQEIKPFNCALPDAGTGG